MTSFIHIDQNQCVRCGQCLLSCPNQLFTRKNHSESPVIAPYAMDVCIHCGHCVAGCPASAITDSQWEEETGQTIPKENIPRFEHISTLVRMRRSIRHFEEKPLNLAKLETLFDVVRWAPSARNAQPIQWIVVQSREKMCQLGHLVADSMRKQDHFKRQVEAWDEGNDVILRGAPVMAVAVTGPDAIFPEVDCAIAVEILDLCAATMHIGSCWAGYFIRAAQADPAIQNWLGLKNDEKVQAALLLGYPNLETYKRFPFRKELEIKWIF